MKKLAIAIALSIAPTFTIAAEANFSIPEAIENYRYNLQKEKKFSNNTAYHRFGVKWNTGGTCGDFDMDYSIQNTLSKQDLQRMMDSWIAQAKNAIDPSSLLALALQRANPDLYEMLMNGIAEARLQFDNDDSVCQALQNTILDSAPDGAIDKLKVKQEFTEKVKNAYESSRSVDIGDMVDFVYDAGDEGIEIMGKMFGGKNQEDLYVIKQATMAGFNSQADRKKRRVIDVNSTASVKGSARHVQENYSFTKYFRSPSEVNEYITTVAGEVIIATAEGKDTVRHTKGVGLATTISEHEEDYQSRIIVILNLITNLGAQPGVRDDINFNLEANKSTIKLLLTEFNKEINPSFFTLDMAVELVNLPDSVKQSFLNSITKEFAYRVVLEKTFAARRILLTGSKESSIYKSEPVRKEIEIKIEELDKEVEQLETEMRIRKYHSLEASATLLRRSLENKGSGLKVNSSSRIFK